MEKLTYSPAVAKLLEIGEVEGLNRLDGLIIKKTTD